MSTTKTWIINQKPKDAIKEDTFKLIEREVPELKDGQIKVKSLYLSNDPAQRTWIAAGLTPDRAYGPCPNEKDPMPSGVLGEVIESKSSKWKNGDKVVAYAHWSEIFVVGEGEAQPAPHVDGQSDSIALSSLGMVSMTAWVGLTEPEVGDIKPTDVVVVSGGAGATGSAVVQIAKNIIGAKKVIALAGGPEKCKWVESLGADACVDYKKDSWKEDLVKALDGEFINLYFDNTGGEILNFVFTKMAKFSRIAACGQISTYNSPDAPVNLNGFFNVVSQRIRVRGFICTDFIQSWPKGRETIAKAIQEGKFSTEGAETRVKATFEEIPTVWQKLFSGQNQGKLITDLQ
ncbi:MDR family NADP-dependent oxidoreductase [Sporobolomyces koalae]|uniref:MDR family NADP-dependent oxidoreductase n=1 Tax=Sporobolomyces koalae TaxID=500713 RepID=UPI00316B7915